MESIEIKAGDKFEVSEEYLRRCEPDFGLTVRLEGQDEHGYFHSRQGSQGHWWSPEYVTEMVRSGLWSPMKPVTYNVTFNAGEHVLTKAMVERVLSKAGKSVLREAARKAFGPTVICGCGKHDVDPAGDLYAQHREWVGKVERRFPFLASVPGVGVSRAQYEASVDEQYGEEFEG